MNNTNYQKNLNKILPSNFLYLVFQDQIKDQFILTKYFEIFPENKIYCRFSTWSYKQYQIVKKSGILVSRPEYETAGIRFDYYRTDDLLYQGIINIKDLVFILSLGIHLRRPDLNGRWILDKESRLGHKIFPIKLIPKCTAEYAAKFNQLYAHNIKQHAKIKQNDRGQYQCLGNQKTTDFKQNKSNLSYHLTKN